MADNMQGVTRYGRWLYRRGPFVRGMIYGSMLPGYMVWGVATGWWRGIQEWQDDRDFLESRAHEALAARSPAEQEEK